MLRCPNGLAAMRYPAPLLANRKAASRSRGMSPRSVLVSEGVTLGARSTPGRRRPRRKLSRALYRPTRLRSPGRPIRERNCRLPSSARDR
jgi:hypothetical protein